MINKKTECTISNDKDLSKQIKTMLNFDLSKEEILKNVNKQKCSNFNENINRKSEALINYYLINN